MPISMKKRSISSLRGSPNRFLKPGALARIRDSKLISLHKSVPIVFVLPPPSPPRQTDGAPCFFTRRVSGGPSFIQRKKLSAAKYVIFVPEPEIVENQAVGLFGSDMVAAH